MTATIHQPDYLPYLGYFYKLFKSDVFIFLDDAQFSNQGGHDCNFIKTSQGACRLKVPVSQTLGDAINQVTTKDELDWKNKHLNIVAQSYKHAPFFEKIFPIYQELLETTYNTIAHMNETIILRFCREFGFSKTIFKSSELDIHTKSEQRILDICHAVNADTYFSGNGAKAYQSEEHFSKDKIKLVYSDYVPVKYPQLWGEFIENLSVLDYYCRK